MHLVILTQYYPPEVGAPQTRLSQFAERLSQRGHCVTILTAMPNYPSGKIHPGYGGLIVREHRNGVSVIRTFVFPTQRTDLARRLANYLSFAFSSGVLGSLLLGKADYLFVETPPLFLGLAALWLSRLKGARLVFNVSDLWPESAVRLGLLKPGTLAYRLSTSLEAMFYKHAWIITGQSKSILSDIEKRFPDRPRFHFSNGVDTGLFRHENGAGPGSLERVYSSGFTVLYAGLHGLAQGLDQMVDAALALSAERDVRFVLVGDGPEKKALIERATLSGLTNVRFHPPRPATEIPALLASADAILVPLKMYIPGAVPSKLYEAMASARPVILMASGEAADIVREHDAGIVIDPGDVDGLVQAIHSLRTDPGLRRRLGANGRRAAEEHYDRAKIVAKFAEFLESNLPA